MPPGETKKNLPCTNHDSREMDRIGSQVRNTLGLRPPHNPPSDNRSS
jgi:hypothetical protein